jgi:3-hydroxyisobutyrate dehydrogenase-like beta-hydroxyacid dehydrogenase
LCGLSCIWRTSDGTVWPVDRVLAGKEKDIEKVKTYCKGVMKRAYIEFIDDPAGNALLLKVIGNTFMLGMVEALAQAQVLAEKSGLGVEKLQ